MLTLRLKVNNNTNNNNNNNNNDDDDDLNIWQIKLFDTEWSYGWREKKR